MQGFDTKNDRYRAKVYEAYILSGDTAGTPSSDLQKYIDWGERQAVSCGYYPGNNITRPSEEPKERELTFDRDTVVPLLYGRRKIEGIPLPVGVVGDKIYICYIFCEGEIEGFEEYFINDEEATEFTGLYGLTPYTGASGQDYDTELHGVNSAWTDKLTGTAYVAAWFTADEKFSGLPKLEAIVKGKKVYDPRGASTAYSTNPILCSVDHLQSKRYGASVADADIDFDLVATAANDCEEQVGGENRYDLNYYIVNPSPIDKVQSYILGHCNGERIFSEGIYHYYVHKSRSAVASFDQDTVWGVNFYRPKNSDFFNRVRASYTIIDTWQEDEYTLESVELSAGEEYESEASFDFTGCSSLSQVHRLATFQLNARRSDLRLDFSTHNTKGVERLDRFTFTHSKFGITTELDFYVISVSGEKITATEYSEDLFSDTVLTNPSLPEVVLIKPTATPDAISNLQLSEVISQAADSHFISTITATWAASAFPWVKHYEIWLKTDGDYVLYDITTDAGATLTTTGEGTTYTVKIVTVSKFNQRSAGVTGSVYVEGKNWPPVWPSGAALTGTEAGDVAILAWDAATDTDTVRYEIRRGRTTDEWGQSAWVATIDALNYFDRSAPAGTWRYFVKAIDSVGGESTALYEDVTVTINPNLAFNRDQDIELTGSTVNQVALSPTATDADNAFPQVSPSATWNDWFPTTTTTWETLFSGNTDGTWMGDAPTAGTIDLVSAVTDMGAMFTGEFTLSYTAVEFGTGTATLTPKLLYSTDGATYTEVDASSAVTLTARYLKAKFVWTCAADNFYVVTEPITVNVKAMPVIEFGTATVGSGGVESIVFDMAFAAVDKVQLTPQGSTAVFVMADNITVSGFDIKVFDSSGSATSGTVGWKVEGV